MKTKLSLLLLLCWCAAARADDVDPFDLSLEEIMHVEVVSVSKRPQSKFTVPSAIYVISASDIQRSGATSLGEALRGVPGLQVSRQNNNDWAISARGFNGTYANKQLVLIDGRVVYNPTFGGVFWDNQELLMSDIERIEVIRGPGAAVWGANAANGVINVITKDSNATQGVSAAASSSTMQRIASARYGFKLGERSSMRLYGKATHRDALDPVGFEVSSRASEGIMAGLRLDSTFGDGHALQLTAEARHRDVEGLVEFNDPLTGQPTVLSTGGDVDTANFLARWTYSQSEALEHSLQFFYNHYDGGNGRASTTGFDTYNLQYQNSWSWTSNQLLTWGVELRTLEYDTQTLPQIRFEPESGTEHDQGIYLHNESSWPELGLVLSLGARIDDNERGGEAIQPKLTVGWAQSDRAFFWASAARASRKASIAENDIRTQSFPLPAGVRQLSPVPFPGPLIGELVGAGDLDNEVLQAYDVGFRWRPAESWSLDVATFYNRYKRLILAEITDVRCLSGESVFFAPACAATSPALIASSTSLNVGTATATGVEVVADWVASESFSMQLNYTYLDLDTDARTPVAEFVGSLLSETSPRHQAALQWHFSPWPRWRADGQLRYVSAIEPMIDSYTVFDLRLSWQPTPSLRVALLGQELGDHRHLEFVDLFDSTPATEIGRTVTLQIEYAR